MLCDCAGPRLRPQPPSQSSPPLTPCRRLRCARALDIGEEGCPAFSTNDDSSAIWSASTVSGATGDTALRSEMTGNNQRSCLGVTLQRPARVAFRWQVSSQERFDYLHYIDDGQRNPVVSTDPETNVRLATGGRFLSGEAAWRDASFEYPGSGSVDIEWCYVKDRAGGGGDDTGYLDRCKSPRLTM